MNFKILNEELENNEFVLAYFWSEICLSCTSAGQFIDQLEKAYRKLKIIKINVQTNLDLAESFEIDTLPTFILFQKSKVLLKIIGFRTGSAEIERRIRNFIY